MGKRRLISFVLSAALVICTFFSSYSNPVYTVYAENIVNSESEGGTDSETQGQSNKAGSTEVYLDEKSVMEMHDTADENSGRNVEDAVSIAENRILSRAVYTAAASEATGYDVNFSIILPSKTYEGHSEIVYDSSFYIAGGTMMIPEDAYESGLFSVEYILSDYENIDMRDSQERKGEKILTFTKPGRYYVELRADAADGSVFYSGRKWINVYDAPDTESVKSGAEKQYRTQKINFRTAYNPDYPLKTLKVSVKNKSSGAVSCADIIKNSALASDIYESEYIKFEEPVISAENRKGYFSGSINFISLYENEENFEWSIYSEDSRGKTDTFTEEFTVLTDLPPEAAIEMSESYIREKGENYAVVKLEDRSRTDGDSLNRKWYIKYAGEEKYHTLEDENEYKDLAGGTQAAVSFRKEGTGKFSIKLVVEDVWTEGTFDIYTAGLKRLSAETEQESEVINIAPHVTAGVSRMKKADIILIGDDSSGRDYSAGRARLETALLDAGAEADINIETADLSAVTSVSGNMGMAQTFTESGPFGYHGRDTVFENGLYTIDNHSVYYIDSVWSDPASGYPEEPYTLSAVSAAYGTEKWKLIFTSELFELDYKKAALYQDDTETYLYLVSGCKTLIIDKKSGTAIMSIDYEAGSANFISGNGVITYKEDGIYFINLEDRGVRKLASVSSTGDVKRCGGLIISCAMLSDGSVIRIKTDPDTQRVVRENVDKIPENLYKSKNYNYMSGYPKIVTSGIDSRGYIMLTIKSFCSSRIYSDTKEYILLSRVYDSSNNLVRSEKLSGSSELHAFPIENSSGHYTGIGMSGYISKTLYVKYFSLESDWKSTCTAKDSNGEPAYYDQVIYSFEHEGKIYITLGADCTWIWNSTWANGSLHGYPARCKTFTFGKTEGNGSVMSGYPPGCNQYSEYSLKSDFYTVVHTSGNAQYVGTAYLRNTVSAAHRSYADVIKRFFLRNSDTEGDNDYRAVILYADNEYESLTDSEKAEIKHIFDSFGYSVLVTGNNYEKAAELSSALGAVNIADDDELYKTAADYIINDAAGRGVIRTEAEAYEGGGYLSRTVSLDPGQRYYYEADIKGKRPDGDFVTVESIIDDKTASYNCTENFLYVTGKEEENFTDEELNEFFTYSTYNAAHGWYTACNINVSFSKNRYTSKSARITFEVPENSRGVLSFDYELFHDDPMGINENYIEIDGVRWHVKDYTTTGGMVQGSYMHPVILESGTHTVLLYSQGYGSRLSSRTCVDNLCFRYISDSPLKTVYQDKEHVNSSENENHISGSFEVPEEIITFRKLAGITHVKENPSSGIYSYLEKIKTSADRLIINIPEGKKALASSIKLKASVSSSDNVRYSWNQDSSTWLIRGTISYPENGIGSVSKDWTIRGGTLSGKVTAEASAGYYSRGSFEEVEMYLYDSECSLVDEMKYIIDGEGVNNSLYTVSQGYSGSTSVKINLAEGISMLSGFRLYTVKDGQRVYIVDNGFESKEDLMKWSRNGTTAQAGAYDSGIGDSSDIPVFMKGETVNYNTVYTDYENDPSKKSFWRYVHTPANDGAFEDAAAVLDDSGNIVSENGKILDHPVEKFFKDGKYTVEHWQTDDTSRGADNGGDSDYDKESNHVFITFYVGSCLDAPWIRYIRTIPEFIMEGDNASIEIGIDDADKDILSLRTEVMCGSTLIYSGNAADIMPDGDTYAPVIINDALMNLKSGKYTVVCTVRNSTGSGMDMYTFNVEAGGEVTGSVYHTEQWELNRKSFNRHFYGRDCDTVQTEADFTANEGIRGKNVFWPGEKIMLRAEVTGKPQYVRAYMEGKENAECILELQGGGYYEGWIWNENSVFSSGKTRSNEKIVFEAVYSPEIIKVIEEFIIIDNSRLYWNIHKLK